MRYLLGVICIMVSVACSRSKKQDKPATLADAAMSTTATMTATEIAASPCGVPLGVALAPSSIQDVVTLINALPKPLTLSCYLKVLQRPLAVNATLSKQGIQKASGPENPRIFIASGALISAILPHGDNSNLLALSELIDATMSVKGEIRFPVQKSLTADGPYQQTLRPDRYGTRCAACHRLESTGQTEDTRYFYASSSLRPAADLDLPLTDILATSQTCQVNPDNGCEILQALFNHGEVLPWAFPPSIPAFE